MTFEKFSSLSYGIKLEKCNRAFSQLSKRQYRLNRLLTVLRNQRRMQEIFRNMCQLNSVLRQTISSNFDSETPLKHKFCDMRYHPSRLVDVCADTCNLLLKLACVIKSDADLDLLFVLAHSIKDTQIRFHGNYYINYNWDYILSTKNPVVPLVPRK